jgi:hypothetical protein
MIEIPQASDVNHYTYQDYLEWLRIKSGMDENKFALLLLELSHEKDGLEKLHSRLGVGGFNEGLYDYCLNYWLACEDFEPSVSKFEKLKTNSEKNRFNVYQYSERSLSKGKAIDIMLQGGMGSVVSMKYSDLASGAVKMKMPVLGQYFRVHLAQIKVADIKEKRRSHYYVSHQREIKITGRELVIDKSYLKGDCSFIKLFVFAMPDLKKVVSVNEIGTYNTDRIFLELKGL